MLVNFKVENYKCFLNETEFSMKKATKQQELDYSVFQETIGSNNYRVLCSSVVYGTNAAGKTNMIEAMETLKKIVLRGHIRNAEVMSSNMASNRLELIPNCDLKEEKPVCFENEFITNGVIYNYYLEVLLGTFLEENAKRMIVEEKLMVNQNLIFQRREDDVEFYHLNKIKDSLIKGFMKTLDDVKRIAKGSLIKDELFLVNGFKNLISSSIANEIISWFQDDFVILYHTNLSELSKRIESIPLDTSLNKVAYELGLPTNELAYVKGIDGSVQLCSLLQTESGKKFVPADMIESSGTIRFMCLIPLILHSFVKGGTFVIDELDVSLHPMIIMNLIRIYHNDTINTNHAQLIFNSHNPCFLDSLCFRRDEIKFVERDDNTCISTIFSLADFKTSGKDGVRKNDNYRKDYMDFKYGAIKDVDLSNIFLEAQTQAKNLK